MNNSYKSIFLRRKLKKLRAHEKTLELQALKIARFGAQLTPGKEKDRDASPSTPKRSKSILRPLKRKAFLASGRGTFSIKQLPSKKGLKANIVRLLGLLDKKRNGSLCRICQKRMGILAYHLVPQQRGDAARFIEANVVWACGPCNFGEMMNRSLYREKHIIIFGKERIERLEEIARTMRKYELAELLELRREIREKIEAPS